jgi:adhesin transport system outer membrane protein
MKLRKALILLLLSQGIANALTLEEAIQQSVITNPEVLFNQAKSLSARHGIDVARGAYLPSVDVFAGIGEEKSLNPTSSAIQDVGSVTLTRKESAIELSQSLFSGGSIVNEFERRKYLYQAQSLKTLGIAEDIAIETTKKYLDVLLQEKLYGLAVNNLKEHRRLFGLIKERGASGLAKEAEVDQSEARLALAESNKISAEGNLREARIAFARVTGIWPKNLSWPKVPKSTELPRTLEQSIEIGSERHPTVKSSYADIKEAKAQYKVARAPFYPKVDFLLRASENRNLAGLVGPNNDQLAIIRVKYNVFKGGSDEAEVRRTAYQVQEAYEKRNLALLDLRESLRLSWNSWITSSERLAPLRRHVRASRKTRSAYAEQFKLGKRTLLDLLDSQAEYYQASIEKAQGYVDEIYSRYRILNGVGQLIYFFKIKVPCNVDNGDIYTSAQRQVITNQSMNDVPLPEVVEGDLKLSQPVKLLENTKVSKENLDKNATIPVQVEKRNWFVQVDIYEKSIYAEHMVSKLRTKGFKVFCKKIGDKYIVFAGPFEYRGLAGNTMRRLKSIAHVKGVLVTFKNNYKDMRVETPPPNA